MRCDERHLEGHGLVGVLPRHAAPVSDFHVHGGSSLSALEDELRRILKRRYGLPGGHTERLELVASVAAAPAVCAVSTSWTLSALVGREVAELGVSPCHMGDVACALQMQSTCEIPRLKSTQQSISKRSSIPLPASVFEQCGSHAPLNRRLEAPLAIMRTIVSCASFGAA